MSTENDRLKEALGAEVAIPVENLATAHELHRQRIGPGSVPHHERCDSLRCVCYQDGYEAGFAGGQEAAARHLLRVAEEIRRGPKVHLNDGLVSPSDPVSLREQSHVDGGRDDAS